ncbi:hypothetical protein SO694_000011221 [Aureococcus anophagefferens]|uniref:IRS-type PTB domain-containing protein n=1 Tax=Aureococcus anophagefferens TaxID=44056 RepID=A0ABR1GBR6_AURAN
MFERGTRVGGRIHSLRGQGPAKDLVVEAGAYRFVLNRTCADIEGWSWCLSTPDARHRRGLFGVKLDALQPRRDGLGPASSRRSRTDGADAGFLTFVEDLLARAESSGRFEVYFGHEVTSLAKVDGGYALNFADGSTAPRSRSL